MTGGFLSTLANLALVFVTAVYFFLILLPLSLLIHTAKFCAVWLVVCFQILTGRP